MSKSENVRRIEWVPLDSVAPAKRNPKKHAGAQLQKSVERFGFAEPLVLDERTGRLVSGHGRLDVLRGMHKAGEKPPEGIQVGADGAWGVPVVRGWSSADDNEADAFLLAANRIGEIGGWDDEGLARLLKDVGAVSLEGVGFSPGDLSRLLRNAGAPAGPEVDEEEPPPTPAKLYVKAGDLWELGGAHRLKVGDSFDEEDMGELLGDLHVNMIATDPPYGIYGSSTGIGSDITDDKMVQPFYEKLAALAHRVLPEFGHAYFFCDWRSWSALWVGARRSGLTAKNLLVWDKGSSGLGSNYANTYELVGFFSKLPPPKAMTSNSKAGQRVVHRANLLRFQRPTGKDREHNAAKPVALMQELIRNSSDVGHLVLEPFAGSGTTLIAAELEKRRCVAMEMEPKFAQVILERFKRVTGKPVRKL